MSARDLVHVLTALARLSGGRAGVGVAVAAIDDQIGRGHDDMRTPLNLGDLAERGDVASLGDGTWALTPEGLAKASS
jgi:hypothetical protein